MNIIEILSSNQTVFAEVSSKNKKVDNLVAETNTSLANLYTTLVETKTFLQSQLSGERNTLIYAGKTLEKFYEGNKLLKVETLVANLKKEEDAALARLASAKEKAMASLTALQKMTKNDAVTSNYDIYDDELNRCPEGHEVLILGEHGLPIMASVMEQVSEGFVLESNFDSVEAGEFQYSMDTVNDNASICEAHANEMFANKPDKVAKEMATVEKMIESAKAVVAYYTAKDMLTRLGCNAKGMKAYENALSKAYIPYKKTLEKVLKVELSDICAIDVDEETFPSSEEMLPADPMTELATASQTELEEEDTGITSDEFSNFASQISEEANEESEEPSENKLSALAENLKNLRK